MDKFEKEKDDEKWEKQQRELDEVEALGVPDEFLIGIPEFLEDVEEEEEEIDEDGNRRSIVSEAPILALLKKAALFSPKLL